MSRLQECLKSLGLGNEDVSRIQDYASEGITEAAAVRRFIGDIDKEVTNLADMIEKAGGKVERRAQLEQKAPHEQRIPKPESDELTLLYSRVEDELQTALREGNSKPQALTTERLKEVTGAPKPRKGKETTLDADVRPRSYEELDSMLKWAMKNDHEGDWYRSFGKGFTELVGKANLQEASILFGITSSQNAAEQNFADTLHIMALARRINPIEHEAEFRQAIRDTTRPGGQHLKISGQQINKIVDMYKTGNYSGGLKVSNYMQVVRARGKNLFTPWSVQDVHMSRVFGWMKKDYKVDKKGNKNVVDAAAFPSGGPEYAIRYAQWMTSLLAREHNITPDQAQAYLWFYGKQKLSPKQGKTLGDGTFKSAMNYAAGDVADIRRMVRMGEFDKNKPITQALGRDQTPTFQSSTQIDPYNNVDPIDALEELASARAPRVIVSTKPGTARGYGFPEGTPLRRLRMYHQSVLDAITDGQGQIKLLTEMRIPHRIRNTIGTWEGLEPSFEIALPGESLETAKMVATVLGDALMQDSAVTAQPKWKGTQFGVLARKPDGSEFTDQELAEVLDAINPEGVASGLQFTATGDKTGLKLTDPEFYNKGEDAYTDQDYDKFGETVTKALGENYTYEHFTQEGDYVDLTRTGQKDRSEIWDQGGLTGRPDLQRTAVRDLYYPAWQVYREFRDYRFHLPHEQATDSPLSGIREGGYPARDPEADGQWNRRAGLTIREDGQVPLTHWGTTPGLTELDPNFYGTGAAGREKGRANSKYWVNKTYYGLPGYRVEGSVQAAAKARYFGTVDAGDLYDLNGDPLGFYHQARKETTNQANRASRVEQLIQESGFKGYWTLGQLPAVAMFEPQRVQPIGKGTDALWEAPPAVAPFDTNFEHQVVPISELKGYEKAHAPERAIPALKKTAEGKLPPRRPPSVREEADGSLTVLDGRSGVTASKELGYDQVPVRVIDTVRDPKTGKVHKLRSKKAQATLESIYDQAARDKDKFDKKVEKLAEEFSGYPLIAVLKGRRKAVDKIRVDYEGDPTKIHDILRATLVIGSAKEAAKARARIEQEFDVVGKSRDLFNDKTWSNGYQDMKFNVRMNGNVYELQVNTPEMLIAKEVYGHRLYDQEVNLDHAIKEEKISPDEYTRRMDLLIETQAKIYGYAKEAHRAGVPLDEFEAELHRRAVESLDELNAQWDTGISFKNSSRETSAPFLNTLAVLYNSGGNVSNRLDQPGNERETTTGIPSTSKNRASSGNSTIISTSSKILTQSDQTVKPPRGGYQPVDQGHVIRMFEAADLSTFMHEAGHLFLQLELSTGSEDTQRILNWLGAPTVDDVLVRPGEDISETKRAYHEKWARGFEAYLLEGKAPTPELQGAFSRMRAWLTAIYENSRRFLKEYGIVLDDDIRGVFDRLLATKEQIAQAEMQDGYAQNFFRDAESAGMTQAEWDDYQNRRKRATEKANQTLVAKLYREIKRKAEKEWKAEFSEEKSKATKDLLEEPVYAARKFLRGKRTEGHTNRLNTEQVKAAFNGEIPKELKGMTHRDSAITPDDMAAQFGYKNGVEFLDALTSKAPISEVSDQRAEQAMLQRHGDILNDGTLEEEAQAAAHNIERGKLILLELRTLNRKTGGKTIERTALKEQANKIIAKTPLGKLRPARYHRAEVRAAKASATAMAKGDAVGAREAKLQQAANFYLWRAATNARSRQEMIRRQIAKAKRSKMTNVAPAYRAKIKSYLSAYDFSSSSKSGRTQASDVLAGVANWMKAQTTDTFEIQTYDQNLDNMLISGQEAPGPVEVKNYREMTLDELEGVYEQLKHLRHMGREMSDAGKAKLQQEAGFLGASLVDTFKGKKKPARGSKLEKFIKKVKGYGANVLLNADTMTRYLDGWKDLGPWQRAIKKRIDDAVTKVLLPMQLKAGEEISAIYNKHYTHEELRKMNKEEKIAGRMMSKWQRIALALNWGTEGNRKAVLEGKVGAELDFNDQQVAEVLDSLEKRDWDFVQDVWDYIETYRDALFEVAKKRNGVAPPAVPPVKVNTKYGTYRGGYYHLKYDPMESWRVTEEQATDMMNNMMLGRFAKAHTPDGALKERVGSGGRPVWLDMAVFHQQIDNTIMTIALSEPVTEVQALLSSKEVREAMSATDNTELLRGLDMWLKDTAVGEVVASDTLNRGLRHLRTGFTSAKLGWNVGTILMQPFGILQSMPVIGYGNMLNGLVKLGISPMGENSAIKQVQAVSMFMQERDLTFNKDLHDVMNQMHGDPNLPGYWPDWMRESMFAGIVFSQRYVDVATWLGAYEKYKNEHPGAPEDDIIYYADRSVARSQASGIWSDRTAVERGTISPNVRQAEIVRIWTTLGSYFFAKGNVAVEVAGRTNFKDPKSAFRFVVDMLVLFSVEATLVGMLRGAFPGGDDDDRSKSLWVMNQTLESLLTTLPFFREIGSEFAGFRGGSVVSQVAKEIGEAKTQVAQGELDLALIKSLNDVGGIMFKYPSSATNRVLDSVVKDVQGKDVDPIDYLMWREKKPGER